MAGSIEGGRKAAATNKAKYGKDFYAKIGAIGGKHGSTGGFYYMAQTDPKRLSEIGHRGGSNRWKNLVPPYIKV